MEPRLVSYHRVVRVAEIVLAGVSRDNDDNGCYPQQAGHGDLLVSCNGSLTHDHRASAPPLV